MISGLFVHAGGMATSVGLSMPASCAAIRANLNRFRDTRFLDDAGKWVVGAELELEGKGAGKEKLRHALALAVDECMSGELSQKAGQGVLLVCLAEADRPGRHAELDKTLIQDVQASTQRAFHSSSRVLPDGRIGGISALKAAKQFLDAGRPFVIIAGVDSYLTSPTLRSFEGRRRLLTSENSDGFIPGEAAAAVIVTASPLPDRPCLAVLGVGFAEEKASVESGEPLRASGLSTAIRDALAQASMDLNGVGYRMTGLSGESYFFREASLAVSRLARKRREDIFDLWHPSDSTGETGAASAVVAMNVAAVASAKGYAPGPTVLLHFSNDNESRAAAVLGQARKEKGR
jgi:3-oxoacyl-[acyl-carrier-protein] synthase-1